MGVFRARSSWWRARRNEPRVPRGAPGLSEAEDPDRPPSPPDHPRPPRCLPPPCPRQYPPWPRLRKPDPVKLICGMIAAETCLFRPRAADELAGRFGPVDVVSDDIPFDMTDYYRAEMGSPLWRRFVRLRPPDRPGRPARRQAMDQRHRGPLRRLAGGARRPADQPRPRLHRPEQARPGQHEGLLPIESSFVTGSMPRSRSSTAGGWQSLLWTFPDYASGRYDAFLTEAPHPPPRAIPPVLTFRSRAVRLSGQRIPHRANLRVSGLVPPTDRPVCLGFSGLAAA